MSPRQIRSLGPDEIIFREGDTGDCAYLIERGRVLIYIHKDDTEVPLKILGEGEVFGEMSLIDNNPRSASCRALGSAQLLVVTKNQLIDRVQAADPVVRLLMRVLLERLRSQNDSIRGKSSASVAPKADLLEKEKREALERISLENRIATGVENDEFLPFYQPICDLQTGEIVGCEALMRWISPSGEVIPPSVFMDVVEESAMILRVGQVVIEKGMTDLMKLRARFTSPDFFVSINVSGRQFTDPHFIDHLERTRQARGLSSHQIKLEVTERVMMEGPQALFTLRKCRSLGYQLAIDDFGTGFSSLQYLAEMPLTDLKIDRAFVMKMLGDQKTLSVIKSLIHMAGLLNLKLIAEGIETEDQLDMLCLMGVEAGQGFHFSKAVALEDFLKLATHPKAAAA